ncbi:hypothetical protein DID99_35400 [Burkholderia sp. Bp8986]|nr:hypothetical protein DID99_35400 [Burkholderia sp. Bp8986]
MPSSTTTAIRQEGASLSGQPAELLQIIACGLPASDLRSLALAGSRYITEAIRDVQYRNLLLAHARQVKTSTEFNTLLGKGHTNGNSIWELPGKFRVPLLVALAGKLGVHPEMQREPIFIQLENQITASPREQRGELLVSLAGSLGMLPEAQRWPAFKRLMSQIKALPLSLQAAPLAALSNQI